jgi:hypothetical protein
MGQFGDKKYGRRETMRQFGDETIRQFDNSTIVKGL